MTNTKIARRALLSSVLSLVLCFAMLLGTTFAWFTDSVTSSGNIIKSGNLDVDLVDEQGDSMEGQIIEFVAKDGRAQDLILWEPGCTYQTEPVYVVNKGNLDLKYEIIINGIVGNAKLLEAIEWTVTVGGVTTDLADLNGTLAAGAKSAAIVLTGHMKGEAGDEYQGLTASGISISVFATQLASENDSFDNTYDDGACLEYIYDSAKSAKENAAALQTLIDAATEGATIVVGAGTYDVSGISGNQIKLAKNGITLLGRTGVVINDDGEAGSTNSSNTQAVIKITGDNVTVNNVYATDKGTNTVILVFGNNVTVTNCTLKGYADPTWGQYLEAGVMIVANDVVNAPITKYTVKNNTFIDCNVSLQNGVGNGGKAEDLIVSGNTFINAGVFIEHNQTNSVTGAVEPWHVTDILVLPTIKNNVFESPSVWLGSTPFAMYLRVYRDNDVATMTPASYWADFVANNTIMDYNGEKLSSDGKNALAGENGVQMRPNGKVQYYGLNFGTAVDDAAGLAAIANGGDIVLVNDVVVNSTIVVPSGTTATLNLNGNDISYAVSNSGASAIIENRGTLTIVGEGTISFVAENPDMQEIPSYATNTITNEATLIIGEGVVVTNESDGGASYAVDNKGVFTLDGGTLIGKRCALRIAKYNQDNVKFTMNSGLVKGATPAWIQLPGSDANVAPTIDVVIYGGTFETTKATSVDNNVLYTYSYGNSHEKTSITINGGEFLGGTVSIGSGYKGDAPALTINDGTFEYDVLQWTTDEMFNVVYHANK